MKIVQVDLVKVGERQDGVHQQSIMTTWVNDRDDLKVGFDIELKKVEGCWRVKKIYNDFHDADEFEWHRKWDNNI